MRVLFSLLIITVLAGFAHAQPTNNPYAARYNTTYHWTDSLNWTSIYNVSTYGAIPNDQTDDRTAIMAAIDAAHAAGGGVVFFPAGNYIVSDSLFLKTGVILRGENPNVADATDTTYLPPSKLSFPEYVPVLTGTGTPNSTAFKGISLHNYQADNTGIVNLDINRGSIGLHPKFEISTTRPTISVSGGNQADNFQPVNPSRNCIIFGVRSNNVTIPDPGIPTATQEPWQRFSWRFAANIDVLMNGNVVIANNRINDAPTDGYDQPGYKASGAPGGVAPADAKKDFNYTDHYGISLNRAKLIKNPNGTWGIRAFHWYPLPWDEPFLFVKGNEIMDNWVFSTMRIKVTAAGNGLVVKNNVIRDERNKPRVYLNPAGTQRQPNFSATYENRGIDFSGFDVLIEGNDVQAFNHGFYNSQYPTICGEGIMNQGNSGGSQVNGVILRNNTFNGNAGNHTNPAFTLYKTMVTHNVLVEGNVATGRNTHMMITAENGPLQHGSNVIIRNNQVNSVQIKADQDGYNYVFENNTGRGVNEGYQTSNNNAIIPCFMSLVNNSALTINPSGCTGPATGTLAVARFTFPASNEDTCSSDQLQFNNIKLEMENGVADSIVIYVDNVRYGVVTLQAGVGNYFGPSFTAPAGYGTSFIQGAVFKNGAIHSWMPTARVSHNPSCLSTSVAEKAAQKPSGLRVYPNPTNTNVVTVSSANPISQLNLISATGQIMPLQLPAADGFVKLGPVPVGVYVLQAIGPMGISSQRVVVQ